MSEAEDMGAVVPKKERTPLRKRLSKKFGRKEFRVALGFGLISLGADLIKGVMVEDLEDSERTIALHAETRARVFALETLLEAGSVVAREEESDYKFHDGFFEGTDLSPETPAPDGSETTAPDGSKTTAPDDFQV